MSETTEDLAALRTSFRQAMELLVATPETMAGQTLPEAVATVLRAMRAAQQSHLEALDTINTLKEDNAMLLSVLRELDYGNPAQAERLLERVRCMDHPGRQLMAEYTDKLIRARAEAELRRTAVATAQDLADHYRVQWNRTIEDLETARRQLASAQERERTIVEVYNQQQSSYRELEGLYSAMTERALSAEQAALRYWTALVRLVRLVRHGGAK